MEKLDLKQYGVQEMCVVGMKEADGGFFMSLAAGYLVGAFFVAADDPQGVLDGFLDAFN